MDVCIAYERADVVIKRLVDKGKVMIHGTIFASRISLPDTIYCALRMQELMRISITRNKLFYTRRSFPADLNYADSLSRIEYLYV